LAVIGTQSAVTILRQIAEPQRSELVAGLPTAAAMASRLLLHYPNDSVGAWIDPDIVVFPPGTTAGEALARIATGNEPSVELVFSVDHDQRLAGVTSLHSLLRVPGERKLASIVEKPPVVLTGNATVAGIARRRGWQQTSVLPVTDRNGKPIGVLRRGALERALARANQQLSTDDSEMLVSMFAKGYWNAFSALAHAAVSLLPAAKSIVSDKS
jgi:magnesium transporter